MSYSRLAKNTFAPMGVVAGKAQIDSYLFCDYSLICDNG